MPITHEPGDTEEQMAGAGERAAVGEMGDLHGRVSLHLETPYLTEKVCESHGSRFYHRALGRLRRTAHCCPDGGIPKRRKAKSAIWAKAGAATKDP